MEFIRVIGAHRSGGRDAVVTEIVNMICGPKFVSANELLRTVKPGDLIEFHRGKYKHWAMYYGKIGNDHYIINIPAESKNIKEVEIKRQNFLEIAGYSPVRVNNQEEEANKRGFRKRSAQDALRAAEQDLDKTVPYSFVGKNCEYYSTKWLYGSGFSTQVHDTLRSVTEIVTGKRQPY